MTRATLLALAARCEAATGPDRDLDLYIHAEADNRDPIRLDDGRLAFRHRAPPHDVCLPWYPERYTASLDAAASLVPAGWRWMAGSRDSIARDSAVVVKNAESVGDHRRAMVFAESVPLALCAAALRAMAEGAGQ